MCEILLMLNSNRVNLLRINLEMVKKRRMCEVFTHEQLVKNKCDILKECEHKLLAQYFILQQP